MKTHSLFTSLKDLKGNARGCVYTEPLWGIPYNLYAPYASIYMIALGLTDKQIGLTVSVSWALQIVFALLSGVITDKLGRRLTTLLSDLISWTIPALISAIALNFWFFLGAALFNSFWRVSHNSWTCLMVEDTDPEQLVDIYSWVYIAGLLVAFFAPLAGLLIKSFSLVPTLRGLYLFAAIMFTVKCITTYRLTKETEQGTIRMRATRHQSVFSVLGEYRGIFREVLHAPQTLYTAGIMLIMSIYLTINGTFWAILVTEKLHIPAQNLAIFPFARSVIMLACFFVVIPRLRSVHFQIPLVVGFVGFLLSQLLLLSMPEKSYALLLVSIFLEACSAAAVDPLLDQLMARSVEAKERARIQSILYVGIILFTSPFGWIAGTLSEVNKSLPFFLNILLLASGAGLAYLAGRAAKRRAMAAQIEVETALP
ncbi:MAG TPA: MFS transporter [Anaerolineales bacterium]|nr:MFS transporter [Anaerolineales bacterium]